MELQPLVEELGEYPFTGLEDARAEAGRKGRELIDFGIGAPAEPVPEVVRAALLDAVADEEVSRYPSAATWRTCARTASSGRLLSRPRT